MRSGFISEAPPEVLRRFRMASGFWVLQAVEAATEAGSEATLEALLKRLL
jgi:hypothetical protein